MSEMTSHLKALIDENASLTSSNDTLSESLQRVGELEAERLRLGREMAALGTRLDKLTAANEALTAAKQLREGELGAQNRRCDRLKHENVSAILLQLGCSSAATRFQLKEE